MFLRNTAGLKDCKNGKIADWLIYFTKFKAFLNSLILQNIFHDFFPRIGEKIVFWGNNWWLCKSIKKKKQNLLFDEQEFTSRIVLVGRSVILMLATGLLESSWNRSRVSLLTSMSNLLRVLSTSLLVTWTYPRAALSRYLNPEVKYLKYKN